MTNDATAPQIALVSPQGSRFRTGQPIAFAASATDDVGVATIAYRLDARGGAALNRGRRVYARQCRPGPGSALVTVSRRTRRGTARHFRSRSKIIPPSDRHDGTGSGECLAGRPWTARPTGWCRVGCGNGAVEALSRVVDHEPHHPGTGATAASAQPVRSRRQVEAAGGDTLSSWPSTRRATSAQRPRCRPRAGDADLDCRRRRRAVTLDRSQTSQRCGVGHFSDGPHRPITAGLSFVSSAPTIASATAQRPRASRPEWHGLNHREQQRRGSHVGRRAGVGRLHDITGITASPNPLRSSGSAATRGSPSRPSFRRHDRAVHGPRQFATGDPNVAIVDSTGLVSLDRRRLDADHGGRDRASADLGAGGCRSGAAVRTARDAKRCAFTALGESQTLTSGSATPTARSVPAPFAVTYSVARRRRVATVSPPGTSSRPARATTSIVVQSLSFTVSVSVSVSLPTTLPPPEIASLGRPIAGDGDTVAILGRHFAGTPAQNFVTINGKRAEVVGASYERVIAIVPPGATSGAVQVRVGGQSSNVVDVAVYPRRAETILASLPFDVPAGGSESVGLGSATFFLQPGDDVVVSADPNTIVGSRWSGLVGPTFNGTLVVTIDGVEHVFPSSPQPINLNGLMPSITAPTQVTVAHASTRGAEPCRAGASRSSRVRRPPECSLASASRLEMRSRRKRSCGSDPRPLTDRNSP